jgi:hypothetical protein
MDDPAYFVRRRKLADEPLCEPCRKRGRLRMAVTAIRPGNSDPPTSLSQLISVCCWCYQRLAPIWGCDVDGWPADPAHPALQERR